MSGTKLTTPAEAVEKSEIILRMNKQKQDADNAAIAEILNADDRKRNVREIALHGSIGSLPIDATTTAIVSRAEEFEKFLNGGL